MNEIELRINPFASESQLSVEPCALDIFRCHTKIGRAVSSMILLKSQVLQCFLQKKIKDWKEKLPFTSIIPHRKCFFFKASLFNAQLGTTFQSFFSLKAWS